MDILQMARELAKAIQADDRYVALALATAAGDNDKDLQEQIGKFNLIRLNLNNEMMKGEEADKEKMQSLNKELGEVYELVMSNPHMKVVAGAQKELDNLIKQVNTILTGCTSCGGRQEKPFVVVGCTSYSEWSHLEIDTAG